MSCYLSDLKHLILRFMSLFSFLTLRFPSSTFYFLFFLSNYFGGISERKNYLNQVLNSSPPKCPLTPSSSFLSLSFHPDPQPPRHPHRFFRKWDVKRLHSTPLSLSMLLFLSLSLTFSLVLQVLTLINPSLHPFLPFFLSCLSLSSLIPTSDIRSLFFKSYFKTFQTLSKLVRHRHTYPFSMVYLSFFSTELSIFYFQFGIHSLIELPLQLKRRNQMTQTLKWNRIKTRVREREMKERELERGRNKRRKERKSREKDDE